MSTPRILRRLLAPVVSLLALTLATTGPSASPAAARAEAPEEGPVTVVRTSAGGTATALQDYLALMALPSVDTGARPVLDAPIYTGANSCPRPRCADRAVPVPPDVQVTSNLVRVLLPQGYRKPRNHDRRYPVIYLWNGVRNDHDSWTYKTELLEMSARWKAIFVMPAGGKLEQAGMFSDWADGTWDWETYHTQVLIPWVDEHYRTLPGARASAGASMGSLGALNYAAHHPGLFQAAVSISGVPDTTALIGEGLTGPPAERPDLRRVWGDPVLDKDTWDRHNPILQIEQLRDVALFITSGTGYAGDGGSDDVVTGDFEKTIWDGHRGFLSQLTTEGVPYTARVTVGGAHNWPYFDFMVAWAMPQLLDVLTAGAR